MVTQFHNDEGSLMHVSFDITLPALAVVYVNILHPDLLFLQGTSSPGMFSFLGALSSLDLSFNFFSGSLPDAVG